MNYPETVESIQKGAVDAVVTLPPFHDSIKSSLGADAVEWSAQSGQLLYGVLTCRNDWIARNPVLLVRLLKAIEQANLYMAQHPKEAKSIVQKRLNLDPGSLIGSGNGTYSPSRSTNPSLRPWKMRRDG